MSDATLLDAMGWHPSFATAFEALEPAGHAPARVIAEGRGRFIVHDGRSSLDAAVSGRLRHASGGDPLAYPAVGDWVATSPGVPGELVTIHALLPRRTAIVRRAPTDHRTGAQVIAANVDVVFIVTSLNGDLNLRRLERYLAVAWESGATPVIVLSKADLDEEQETHRLAVESVAREVEIIVTSAVTRDGMDLVHSHLAPGRTVVFIGSSGVGKSTLVNTLAGHELVNVAGIREADARGRHTTSARQLVPLADGLVIDTPGMRELALLDSAGLAITFDDVETYAIRCRFGDCGHRSEPGCAVRDALADGSLNQDRFDAYEKLAREAHRSELSTDAVARKAERRKWIARSKGVARHMDMKYGGER